MRFFVGLDWASELHAVCVVDDAGGVRWQGTVAHSAAGLTDLTRRLSRFGPPSSVAIALERPSGILVDTLVDAGYVIVPIHPNALKASRPRYTAAGSKSDSGDAFILADLLRTDGHRWRPLRPLTDDTRPCAPSCAAGMISSPSAPPSPISCGPCSSDSGRGPPQSSPT